MRVLIQKMSKFEDNIYKSLTKMLPYTKIYRQYSVKYEGRNLFFDFYIKDFNMFIECQGNQHYEYTRFFHGTIMGFRDSKYRDKLKREYVDSVGGVLIALDYDKHKDTMPEDLIDIVYSYYI